MIAFVQPFGLRSPGGGARILRALLEAAPERYLSICTSVSAPASIEDEIHLPLRPAFGRLEATRARGYLDYVAGAYSRRFTHKLVNVLRNRHAAAVHAVAHDLGFAHAFAAAQVLELPFYLNAMDDLSYVLRDRPDRRRALALLGGAWRGASWRFVISEELGREYCRRYTDMPYSVVTDGVETNDVELRPRTQSQRLYFMGLLHLAYEANFLALLDAIGHPELADNTSTPSLTCRCGSLPLASLQSRRINVRPFGTESDVDHDLEEADILYLPLPFGAKHELFARFSLSTKLVTYLASGIPILYHGPAFGAMFELLSAHDSALVVTSLDSRAIVEVLKSSVDRRQAVARNALALARRSFRLDQQQQRFWREITAGNGSAG